MPKTSKFILYFIHSAVLLYFASTFYPQAFVLGNHLWSYWGSIFVAGFIWTFVTRRLYLTILTKNTAYRFFLAWFFNFAALWITARIAPYSGFGAVRYTWLVGLAFIAELIQIQFEAVSKK